MANKLTHLSLPLCAPDVAPAPAAVARRLVTRQSAGTKPDVTIRLQPSVGDRVAYLALGPTKEGGTRQWKLVVGVRITNNEPQDIALTGVRFTFPSSQVPEAVMYRPDLVTDPIPPGQSAWWSSGVVGVPNTKESKYNAVYHDLPAPAGVRIHLQFAGYTQEIAITAPLVRHEAPVAGKGYRFPFSARDLAPGEWFTTSARHWANGGASGTQIFAHDISVVGVRADGSFSRLVENGRDDRNADYRIHGLPVRAMADGVVIDVDDGMAENTPPGFPDPAPAKKGGNVVRVRHGTDIMRYCHFQPGTIPAAVVKDATVKAGQVLGLCGNTGNSSAPHLHIECTEEGLGLQPMPLRDTWVIDEPDLTSERTGPWALLAGEGIPLEPVLIWPAPTKPGWYPPEWGEVSQTAMPAAQYQRWAKRAFDSHYRPEWVDAYEVGGQTFFNALYRWDDKRTPWISRHGLTAAEYQASFTEQTGKGFRLSNLTSYVEAGRIRYACIFEKKAGPAWIAYHGRTHAQHLAEVARLDKDGFGPVNVSVVSINGERSYAAFFEKDDGTSWRLHTALTPAQYEAKWEEEWKAGRRVTYLSAYQHDGGVRFSAVFRTSSANPAGRHDLSVAQLGARIDEHVRAGRLTRCVAGYAVGGQARFGAVWR